MKLSPSTLLFAALSTLIAIPSAKAFVEPGTAYCTEQANAQRKFGYEAVPLLTGIAGLASTIFTLRDSAFQGQERENKRFYAGLLFGTVVATDLVLAYIDRGCTIGQAPAGERHAFQITELSDAEAKKYREQRRRSALILLGINTALYGIQFAMVEESDSRAWVAASAALPLLYAAIRTFTYKAQIQPTMLRSFAGTPTFAPGLVAAFSF